MGLVAVPTRARDGQAPYFSSFLVAISQEGTCTFSHFNSAACGGPTLMQLVRRD